MKINQTINHLLLKNVVQQTTDIARQQGSRAITEQPLKREKEEKMTNEMTENGI